MIERVNQTQLRKPARGFSVGPFFGDLLVLSRMLRDAQAGFGLKAVSLFTLLYVVCPIDLIPEAFMPMVAWIDDVGLVITLRLALDGHFAKYRYPLFSSPAQAAAAAGPVDLNGRAAAQGWVSEQGR